MKKRVLVSTTSFQDTPGPHQGIFDNPDFECVRERGPLPESRMLELVGELDGMICGDDSLTAAVLEKALPRLKVISKYGIGLDRIDVEAATRLKLPVLFTPGVNHTTVAEHTFGLLLALRRQLVELANHTRAGQWKRLTGHEIMGSAMGIVGLGRIGREVALRARAFGLELLGFDPYWDEAFARELGIERMDTLNDLLQRADIVSLHTALTEETRGMIGAAFLATMKPGAIVINCARGELVESAAMAEALREGRIAGYGTDVLETEPPPADHPLLGAPNCIVTPHVGSRTFESVQRQAGMALENLYRALRGDKPLAQANSI